MKWSDYDLELCPESEYAVRSNVYVFKGATPELGREDLISGAVRIKDLLSPVYENVEIVIVDEPLEVDMVGTIATHQDAVLVLLMR